MSAATKQDWKNHDFFSKSKKESDFLDLNRIFLDLNQIFLKLS